MEVGTILSVLGPATAAAFWLKGKITEHDVRLGNIEGDLKEVKDLLFAEFRGDPDGKSVDEDRS